MKRYVRNDMYETIKKLLANGKGIWAADASPSTMAKRFEKVGIIPTDENRFKFRELTVSTSGIGDFISGIILHDESIRQKNLLKILDGQGIVIGIKVDKGAKDMANFPQEKITEGLDELRERLIIYKKLGARFAKWRAVFTIGDKIPSETCINSNAEALARYAALCQEADMVPIVEPEVLMDGDHDIVKSEEVTLKVLKTVFDFLGDHKIAFEKMLLKPNFVHPGKENKDKVSSKQIAQVTLRVLRNAIVSAVPGIMFLSGGDDPEEITVHLNDLNKLKGSGWNLAFSFERALEGPAMEKWMGNDANIDEAQKALYKRAKMNSLAREGKYNPNMEKDNGE